MPSQLTFDAAEFIVWIDKINELLEKTDGVFSVYNPAYSPTNEMSFLWNDKELSISVTLEDT